MLENCFVFADVPSSTRLKLVSGDGLAVNGNDVLPSGVASLMIVIEAGKMTASAARDRSCFPVLQWPELSLTPLTSVPHANAMSAVWYGDPEIVTAELLTPQSTRVEMWPPQASTASPLVLLASRVNEIVISV